MVVNINNQNVNQYIQEGLIDPSKIKIDINTQKTASDPNHKWLTLQQALDSKIEFNFDYDVKRKLKEIPTLPEFTVSAPSLTSINNNKNTRKGVDLYNGVNYSSRFDKSFYKMGNTWMFHPQNYINKNYWKSDTHKNIKEGANTAAIVASAPFAAYTIAQTTPFVLNGLKIAGQAMTPSTWIGGGMQGAGYVAPNWLLNGADLTASAYFANEAGKEIDENGLNWKTGTNALMSLAPFTRETEAIDNVANTFKTIKNTLKTKSLLSKPRINKEFNTSINSNVFDFFDEIKPSKNDKDIFWGKLDGDNYLISKYSDGNYHLTKYDDRYNEIHSNFFRTDNDLYNYLNLNRNDFIKAIQDERKIAYSPLNKDDAFNSTTGSNVFQDIIKNQILDDIDNFYMLPQYLKRYNPYDQNKKHVPYLRQALLNIKDRTTPVSYNDPNSLLSGFMYGTKKGANLGLNVGLPKSTNDFHNTISHEFGHSIYHQWPYLSNTKEGDALFHIKYNNDELIGNPLDHLNPDIYSEDDFVKYLADPDELRQRLIPYVKLSMKENLTPEQTYARIKDENLLETFTKSYLVKLIGGLLATIPILNGNNIQTQK